MCKLYNLKQKDFCFLQFPGKNCMMMTKVTFPQFRNENSKSLNKTKLYFFCTVDKCKLYESSHQDLNENRL